MRPRRNTEEDWSDSEVLLSSFDDDDANATNFFPLPILLLPSRSTTREEDKEEELRKKRHPRLLLLLLLLLVHCEEDAVRRTDDDEQKETPAVMLDDFVDKTQHFSNSLCCTKFRALNPNSSKSSLFLPERTKRGRKRSVKRSKTSIAHHHGFDCRRRFPAHFARFKHERRWTREGT
jgi:hypothetical protein